jgi:hypothetical protein
MGLGDWLMASGDAKEANERTGKKVKLGDGVRMSWDGQVFANNPRMASNSDTDIVWVKNYQGHRPYLKGTKNGRLLFNDDYKPRVGEVYFNQLEKKNIDKIDKDYIVVEPNVKRVYAHTVNKAWHGWEELFKHDLPWLQLGDVTVKRYTKWKETNTFREALQVLSKAKLFIGTDGGLHHAAAALGIPSVVIWTGFTSPRHLGYDTHTNIHDGSEPCGTYDGVCQHCLLKSKAITVEQVLDAVNTEWHRTQR